MPVFRILARQTGTGGERTAVVAPGINSRLFSPGKMSSPTSANAEGERFAITNRTICEHGLELLRATMLA